MSDTFTPRPPRPAVFRYENYRDRHHLDPHNRKKPTVTLWRWKHNAWHRLFARRALPEIVGLLYNRNGTPWYSGGNLCHVGNRDWRILFGAMSSDQAFSLLQRLMKIKYGRY